MSVHASDGSDRFNVTSIHSRADLLLLPVDSSKSSSQQSMGPREDAERHNHEDSQGGEAEQSPKRIGLRDRIVRFTWPWFSCTMSTGAVAVVLGQTPNKFTGLQTIGKIFFILDIVLFVLFTAIMTGRFILAPRKFLTSLHHPVEALFFGAFWVSISLILNGMQAYAVPACGLWLVRTLQVLFWIYCAMVSMVAVLQYYVIFAKERLSVAGAMPAWIFPIYPLLVVGPMAGTFIPSQPQSAAYPMWVGAVMLQGLAWTVAIMMYSIYTQRLMTASLPPPPNRPGMYVSVGPAGYTAAGLISLGRQAPNVMPNNVFNMSAIPDGDIVKVIGILAGTFLVVFAFWFFLISTVSVLAGAKKMSFTLNWWAFIFPNGGLTLATIQVGAVYHSPGINGLCSALTILLVIMWLLTAAVHLRVVVRSFVNPPPAEKGEDKGS